MIAHAHQQPFERDFGVAAQMEAPEPEHFLDNAEDGERL
ncbi:MAG: hypothetical protein RLZZ15_857 [Verrucomicrobiota bacterium]|jgi:hypothetical protein